ncbi:Aldehyde dehydrogenase [Cyphellophora attinorum]|uniref:aldehyde dehydrogenase (NAD(+)) n=1 Tax=Cyphellophora attinorum TaxID=1664694 RepID=A0A0N0NPM6_9EURO|nr:Aldehyde dehydrogenase [Phialophora attinorum]KPI42898.1 Aldehyde dehydrogenase [Phialophora attinorum]
MSKPERIETRLFINGKFVEASDKKTFPIYSPHTQEKVAEGINTPSFSVSTLQPTPPQTPTKPTLTSPTVSEATAEDTDAAVKAALKAFPSWSALSPKDRGVHLKKLASLIRASHKELAWLEAMSMGRPVSQYIDAFAAADDYDHYAEVGYDAQGTSSLNTPGFVNLTFRQPYGVVAAIIPWNVPALFFAKKSAPALMAGNTVVVKSSEKAPLTSAYIAGLIEKAGFPPGVFNVLSGHGNVSGAVLSSHMDVRALSFTGSCRTGKTIQAAAAKSNLKSVILELGGKSPAIVFDDADLDAAVEETQHSVQWNSGQVCMANTRLYVHSKIADKFVEKFKARFVKIKPGDPTDADTNHGPQADKVQYDNVQRYIELARKAGELVLGGEPLEVSGDVKGGYFVAPTVFLKTGEDEVVMKEEIFGPVIHINTFESEEEVIKKANDTEFGLYASVYTKNIDRAMRFAKALDSGTVGVNCTSPTGAKDVPFGGYKQSGQGREGHKVSLDNFLETKTVLIKVAAT